MKVKILGGDVSRFKRQIGKALCCKRLTVATLCTQQITYGFAAAPARSNCSRCRAQLCEVLLAVGLGAHDGGAVMLTGIAMIGMACRARRRGRRRPPKGSLVIA